MSTQVVAEYPEENFAILRDGGGTYIFTRSDSILPVDEDHCLTLMPSKSNWAKAVRQSQLQDDEDDVYNALMH